MLMMISYMTIPQEWKQSMNMHSATNVEPEMINTPTPDDLKITPRDRRFGRDHDSRTFHGHHGPAIYRR